MERKLGTVYSTNPKGWIFIYVTVQDRYFGHISELRMEKFPAIGDKVTFGTAPSRKPGQLPCATDIKPDISSAEAAQ